MNDGDGHRKLRPDAQSAQRNLNEHQAQKPRRQPMQRCESSETASHLPKQRPDGQGNEQGIEPMGEMDGDFEGKFVISHPLRVVGVKGQVAKGREKFAEGSREVRDD
jgi:hypothetical protein